jgi:hypothetical protein
VGHRVRRLGAVHCFAPRTVGADPDADQQDQHPERDEQPQPQPAHRALDPRKPIGTRA